MHRIIYLLWVLSILIISVSPALALDFQLTSYPSQISESDELSAGYILSCSGCGDSYIRAVFFPSGTNYFGYTQNQVGDWINQSSDKTKFLLLSSADLASGTYSGILKDKIDPADSAYTGTGSYNFKLIRYTPTCSKSGETNSVAISVVSVSTPTPLPTSTTVNTQKPSNTKTPTPAPTLTKTPIQISTPIPTPKPTITNTPLTPTPTFTELFTPVLATTSAVETIDNHPTPKTNPLGLFIVGLGIVIIGFGGFLFRASQSKMFR